MAHHGGKVMAAETGGGLLLPGQIRKQKQGRRWHWAMTLGVPFLPADSCSPAVAFVQGCSASWHRPPAGDQKVMLWGTFQIQTLTDVWSHILLWAEGLCTAANVTDCSFLGSGKTEPSGPFDCWLLVGEAHKVLFHPQRRLVARIPALLLVCE